MFKKLKEKMKGEDHSTSSPASASSSASTSAPIPSKQDRGDHQHPRDEKRILQQAWDQPPHQQQQQQYQSPQQHQQQQPLSYQPSYQQSALHPNNPYYAAAPQPQHHAPQDTYTPPPGPPPSFTPHQQQSDSYTPPPGPPPSQTQQPPPPHSQDAYAPPPGPPPSQDQKAQHQDQQEPPPYHDWTIIPDTALLPPPPSLGNDFSPTANATLEEGAHAYEWCLANPLWAPQPLSQPLHAAIQHAQLALLAPPTFSGALRAQRDAGHWGLDSARGCRDACVMSNLPLYAAAWDSPVRTRAPKTVYFEVQVLALGSPGPATQEEADAGVAIGFVAPPYPAFRLPGWQRGSVGVHGDDGRRYVNDPFGGVDFTTAFQAGERVGLGMTFSLPKLPPSYEAGGQQPQKELDVEVFFTRNGVRQGGWDGNEELDAERSEGGNEGLRGERDLFPAVGVFGACKVEVVFHPAMWKYRPW